MDTVLNPAKFKNPDRTAKGEPRAVVSFGALDTLWFNTGTLCNITCSHCYIESSPINDRLSYLTLGDVTHYLDELDQTDTKPREIGFTGGEPFMNPDMIAILATTLARGFQVLVLTNAMRPMRRSNVSHSLTCRRTGLAGRRLMPPAILARLSNPNAAAWSCTTAAPPTPAPRCMPSPNP